MNYFISRRGQQYGPYSLADVQKQLAQGSISPDDDARTETMTNWAPLSRLFAKKWYREPWFKILTFLFLTPLWVLIVFTDRDERKSVKFLALVVLIVYIAYIKVNYLH